MSYIHYGREAWKNLPVYLGDATDTSIVIPCPKCDNRVRPLNGRYRCFCGWSRAEKSAAPHGPIKRLELK